LASIMLTLTIIITLDTARRWYVLLANGRSKAVELAEEELA